MSIHMLFLVLSGFCQYNAATSVSPQYPESASCCACYDLTFTTTAIAGKRMVVQSISVGEKLGERHFDIQIPGGGVGKFKKGCFRQWGAPADGWGARYGGVSSVADCQMLPVELQSGCVWYFDWYKSADNPLIVYERVRCPQAITSITQCIRDDDHLYADAPGTTATGPSSQRNKKSNTLIFSSSASPRVMVLLHSSHCKPLFFVALFVLLRKFRKLILKYIFYLLVNECQ